MCVGGQVSDCRSNFSDTAEGKPVPTELRGDAVELRKAMKYDDEERAGELLEDYFFQLATLAVILYSGKVSLCLLLISNREI